jgi:hypothetical protein
LKLSIAGIVENIVKIQPRRVLLRGFAGKPIKQTVTIVPQEKYPLRILEADPKQGKNFNYQLEPVNKAGSFFYVLTVENLMQRKGRYFGTIRLKTDSKLKPMINIPVQGSILEGP